MLSRLMRFAGGLSTGFAVRKAFGLMRTSCRPAGKHLFRSLTSRLLPVAESNPCGTSESRVSRSTTTGTATLAGGQVRNAGLSFECRKYGGVSICEDLREAAGDTRPADLTGS